MEPLHLIEEREREREGGGEKKSSKSCYIVGVLREYMRIVTIFSVVVFLPHVSSSLVGGVCVCVLSLIHI